MTDGIDRIQRATAPTGPLPTEEVRPDVEVLDAVAYLAGPYRDPRGAYWVRENIRTAERVALQLWQHGLPTLCPHLNTALWDGAGPDDLWLHGDLIMLSRCDLVILGPGWQHSPGAQAERAKADQIGIPVIEWAGGLNLEEILALGRGVAREGRRRRQCLRSGCAGISCAVGAARRGSRCGGPPRCSVCPTQL